MCHGVSERRAHSSIVIKIPLDVLQANKKPTPLKESEPLEANSNESEHGANATPPLTGGKTWSQKRRIELVDMTNDDGEDPPLKIMKVEVPENENRPPIPGGQKEEDNLEKSRAKPTELSKPGSVEKPKSQRQIEDYIKPLPAHGTKPEDLAEIATNPKDEKARKRMKMIKQ